MDSTQHLTKLFEARRKHGGFMRHRIETTLPDGTTGTMIGGILSGDGVITVAEKTYDVERSVMSDGKRGVADYTIGDAFLGLPSATIDDLEHERTFMLRQRRIWSSTLILLEHDIQIGEFRSSCLQSPYRILVDDDVSTKVVLLCVWVIMVRMAFAA